MESQLKILLNLKKTNPQKIPLENLNFSDNKINIKEIFIKTKYGDERSQLHVIYALRFFYNSIKFFLFNKSIK